MDNPFSILRNIIENRRSIKPVQFNGNKIPDDQVKQLLELADWAPTHGNTEPWRFIVYSGGAEKALCFEHAQLYKNTVPPENFLQANYDKILHNGDKVSHIIIAIMQRGKSPKITLLEEEAATAAAMQNILLGATALGIASFWSTGGIVHNKAFKDYLQLKDEDVVMGILFLGYSDITIQGKRITPLSEKVNWIKQ